MSSIRNAGAIVASIETVAPPLRMDGFSFFVLSSHVLRFTPLKPCYALTCKAPQCQIGVCSSFSREMFENFPGALLCGASTKRMRFPSRIRETRACLGVERGEEFPIRERAFPGKGSAVCEDRV